MTKNKKKKGIAIVVIIVLAAVIVAIVLIMRQQNSTTPKLIGGDRDEHGCLTPAGYSWCQIKNKCLRLWEEPCQ